MGGREPLILSIDLGTSSVKAALIDLQGRIVAVESAEYPILSPLPGYAEQDPEEWWNASVSAVRRAVLSADGGDGDGSGESLSSGPRSVRERVKAVGLDGQMHGLAAIDRGDSPVGNSIIWPDRRAAREAEDLVALIGKEAFARVAGTPPAAGFMGPTLLWLKRNDPRTFGRIDCCLFPKDYIRLKMTGNRAAEPTDGCSSALFDIRERTWSGEIIRRSGLSGDIFPPVLEPADIAGELRPRAAEALGLAAGIPVVAGAADQAAQAVGSGLTEKGQGSVTLGSGGQIFVPLQSPAENKDLNIHVFCHAPQSRWYILGAMLTAGLALRWWRDLRGKAGEHDTYEELSEKAAETEPGAEGLIFLPYLAGERSPVMDPHARGCFIGLTLEHKEGHIIRAVMEGVAFSLRQILETVGRSGGSADSLLASGNGLAAPFWRQIVTDVLGKPLLARGLKEQASVGAALIAGIGSGFYSGYPEAVSVLPRPREISLPDTGRMEIYEQLYARFCRVYPQIRPLFQ